MNEERFPIARTWLPSNEAIATRRAVRGFLPTPVPLSHVRQLLALASRAPSGSNIQPWNMRVLAGAAKTRLTAAILRSLPDDPAQRPKADWDYYPVKWREPYIGRRRKLGWSLYGLMGIGKGDTETAEAFRRRNYDFFGAPVGMIFTLDADLEIGSWLDFGIFLGELMIAARGAGLDTCPQQSFADVHAVVHVELDIPDTQKIICGMALGYADSAAVPNRLVTEREPVERFANFSGFEAA
jgi:nitroreductase